MRPVYRHIWFVAIDARIPSHAITLPGIIIAPIPFSLCSVFGALHCPDMSTCLQHPNKFPLYMGLLAAFDIFALTVLLVLCGDQVRSHLDS